MYEPKSRYGYIDEENIGSIIGVDSTDSNDFLMGSSGIILSLIGFLKEDTIFQEHLVI